MLVKQVYYTPATITCGMDGLTNNSSRASTYIDNSSNLYLDVLIKMQFLISTGTLATNPIIYVYAYASLTTSNFTDGVTGTDAAYTLPTLPNSKLIQAVSYTGSVGSGSSVYTAPFSVAAAFGFLPEYWGIIVNNQTGCTLAGTSGQEVSNTVSYQGLQVQTV